MQVDYTKEALRDLKKFDRPLQRRIVAKLTTYANSPEPYQFARKLKDGGSGQYRFRIGAYRAICDIKAEKITVITIGHRRDIYR